MKKIFFITFYIIFLFCRIFDVSYAIEDLSEVTANKINQDILFFLDEDINCPSIDDSFIDENLKLYLDFASKNNFSIKIAQDRINEYLELSKSVNSLRLPWISIAPSANNQRTLSVSSNKYTDTNLYTLPVSLNWELDLFQKNTLKYKSSKLDIKIKEEELKQVKLPVDTDLKNSYFNLLLSDF